MPKIIKNIYQLTLVFSLLGIFGLAGCILRLVSMGYLCKFNRKHLMPWVSKLLLKLCSMKLILPANIPLSDRPAFITFNHNSYLDIFALTALGIENARFLLSEKTIRIIPFTLAAIALGVIYIPQKKHAKRRLKFFINLEKKIKREQFHVLGSSEGVHSHFHGIDSFNNGVYHMAIACKMPIVPLFIFVPKESNPFNTYKYVEAGTIQIDVLELQDAAEWKLEDLERHKNDVRKLFVDKFNAVNDTQIT